MERGIRLTIAILLVSGLAATTVWFGQQADAQETKEKSKSATKPPTVMQRKLIHSQKLLEGLAVSDFEKIKKAAEELQQCVKEATWRINETEKYLMFSNMFLRDLEDLQKAAEKKNIDAAALSYADMTRTCVKCHKHLRETGLGSGNRDNLRGLAN